MRVQQASETQTFSKEVPYLTIKFYPAEVRRLYQTILNNGEDNNFNRHLLETLTEFLSDYDSGKYDKLTKLGD